VYSSKIDVVGKTKSFIVVRQSPELQRYKEKLALTSQEAQKEEEPPSSTTLSNSPTTTNVELVNINIKDTENTRIFLNTQ
jgi:hypothetical protein